MSPEPTARTGGMVASQARCQVSRPIWAAMAAPPQASGRWVSATLGQPAAAGATGTELHEWWRGVTRLVAVGASIAERAALARGGAGSDLPGGALRTQLGGTPVVLPGMEASSARV